MTRKKSLPGRKALRLACYARMGAGWPGFKNRQYQAEITVRQLPWVLSLSRLVGAVNADRVGQFAPGTLLIDGMSSVPVPGGGVRITLTGVQRLTFRMYRLNSPKRGWGSVSWQVYPKRRFVGVLPAGLVFQPVPETPIQMALMQGNAP